jgi:sensor histidine kinase regulating citrate/malate metabolism
MTNSDNYELHHSATLPYYISVNLLLLLVISFTVLHHNHITSRERELSRLKTKTFMTEMVENHIFEVTDAYDKLIALRHDIRNHIYAIKGFIVNAQYDSAILYIDNLYVNSVNKYEYTTHVVLNALISTRAVLAKNRNIIFNVDNIVLPKIIPLTDVDICILFGNILDNAFEAITKVIDSPYIDISSSVRDSNWIIACRNSTADSRNYNAVGFLKSTKSDASHNGIGTRQINEIAENNGGFVSYKCKDNEFTILVSLSLEQ